MNSAPSDSTSAPSFSVTGAPNKGKSSLLKAITNDYSIEVSEFAGTTKQSKAYPMKLNGEEEYRFTIWDTPGFENAQGAVEKLEEMQQKAPEASKISLIREFVALYAKDDLLKFEAEIMRSWLPFSGIIFVADCSKPYSEAEYVWELRLIEWSELPSIGVLNPVEGEAHKKEWKQAFRNRRMATQVFNPVMSNFEQRIEIFNVLAQLHSGWQAEIEGVIQALRQDRAEALYDAAQEIRMAVMQLYSTAFYVWADDLKDEGQHQAAIAGKVKKTTTAQLEEAHHKLKKRFNMRADLCFDAGLKDAVDESELFEGVNFQRYFSPNQQAMIYGLLGGGIGAGVDAALGGLTFGVFTVMLGGAGGAYGYFQSLGVEDLMNPEKITRRGNKYEAGPLTVSLGYVVINRLRELVFSLYHRSAANESPMKQHYDFSKTRSIKLTRLLQRISKSEANRQNESNKRELLELMHKQLKEDVEHVS